MDFVREFLVKDKNVIMPETPYSKPIKGKRFATSEEIKKSNWKNCWHKCIVSEGGYFEGYNIVTDK